MSHEEPMAIGMIACPRQATTATDTLCCLRFGGFHENVYVFAEPGTEIDDLPGVVLRPNERKLGAPANWFGALDFLIKNTGASRILMMEDDVAFCRGARDVLDSGTAAIERFGYFSLYTPVREADRLAKDKSGWVPLGKTNVWGTQAVCFHRESLKGLVEHGTLLLAEGRALTYDLIMAEYFRSRSVPCFYHVPSLCDHTGWWETTIDRDAEFLPNMDVRHLHRGLGFDPDYGPTR